MRLIFGDFYSPSFCMMELINAHEPEQQNFGSRALFYHLFRLAVFVASDLPDGSKLFGRNFLFVEALKGYRQVLFLQELLTGLPV